MCAFHLNNHEAKRDLHITWEGKKLENTPFPVYLGVTLDRTLSFREHVIKLKKKLSTRNNILDKLANSTWGADPLTLKTTAMAVCFSTAEYCSPVWTRSAHAHKVNVELNRACRTITGTLRATPLQSLYRLASIPPPQVRREAFSKVEKDKQITDVRHPLHGHVPVPPRLSSRRSFATVTGLAPTPACRFRLVTWRELDTSENQALPEVSESLPSGTNLTRRDWVTLNRARAKVGRTGDNMLKWGLKESAQCPYGHQVQTFDHIQKFCPLSPPVSDEDLRDANDNARRWILVWRETL